MWEALSGAQRLIEKDLTFLQNVSPYFLPGVISCSILFEVKLDLRKKA